MRELGVGYYSALQIESTIRYVVGVDRQLIADGTYYVAEADGQIAGCGGWSWRKTLYGGDQAKPWAGNDHALDPATEPAKVRAFFVHPDWARRGIGRRLLATCELAARRAGFRRLELLATLSGEPLYAAAGYVAREGVELTLPDGVRLPLTRMEKVLP
jgi:GNAT superfamily N-acetyltransferase